MIKRIKSILVVIAIFMSGIIVGGIGGASHALVDVVNDLIRGGPVQIRRTLLQRARQELRLDEDQAHQFWAILNDTGAEIRDITKPVRPDLEATINKAAGRIRNVLRADQRPEFERFLKASQAKWIAAIDGTVPVEPATTATPTVQTPTPVEP